MRRPGIAACVLASLASCAEEARERPNVLLITIDTLRADRLGCYGYGRPTTPRIDELAREGVVFERASTPRAKTTPAIASLLTGAYPHEHGVRDLAQPLGDELPMLQERLSALGYRTGAVVGNWVLADERSGLARGFDLWCESLPDSGGVPPHDVPQRGARSLTDGALVALGLTEAPEAPFEPRGAFVEEGEPWFLWLHYMDPHGSYDPPAEHRVFASERPEPLDPADEEAGGRHPKRVALYNVPADARLEDGSIDAATVKDRYDGEIRYVDAEIGRLVDALRTSGALERTVIVVTSDHGESLGEHRYWFEHGLHAYESTNRVPLVVRAPEGARGARDGRTVSLVDVAGIVAEATGLEVGDPAPGGPVFYEKVERAEVERVVQIKGVRVGDWKLLHRYATKVREGREEVVLVGEEVFDLAADPGEEWDLTEVGGASRAPIAELRRELAGFVAEDGELARLAEVLARRRKGLEERDPEAVRVLRALGY